MKTSPKLALESLLLEGDGDIVGLGKFDGSIKYESSEFKLDLGLKEVKLPDPFLASDTVIKVSATVGQEMTFTGDFSTKLKIDKAADAVDITVNVRYSAGE